jgi:ADP-ribosyl-[dinitrogen reductase] hydrolase
VAGDATQDRMLGAILGFSIGDAMGMPVFGWSRTTIADWYGPVTGYHARKFPDGTEVSPGEITDDTELALCIIESITAAQGDIHVENIGIRMAWLARGESRRWLHPTTLAALEGSSEEHDYRLPLRDDEIVGADMIARGLPIGLLHSMGKLDSETLNADAETIARITHGSPLAHSVVQTAARMIADVTRASDSIEQSIAAIRETTGVGAVSLALDGERDDVPEVAVVLAEAAQLAVESVSFESLLQTAVEAGGASDSRAAFAAALYAGHKGTAVIPQRLIDDLESRIYVSLAVPWFYRTVAKRNGRAIDLRMQQDRF